MHAAKQLYAHEVRQLAVVLPEFGSTRGTYRISLSLKGRTLGLFIPPASFFFSFFSCEGLSSVMPEGIIRINKTLPQNKKKQHHTHIRTNTHTHTRTHTRTNTQTLQAKDFAKVSGRRRLEVEMGNLCDSKESFHLSVSSVRHCDAGGGGGAVFHDHQESDCGWKDPFTSSPVVFL